MNDTQLEEAVKLAAEKKLVICDGMTLYHMPIFKKLKEIVDSGKLGPVKMIQVNFGSCKEYDVTNRFFSKELAGGALLDIGVYATSFARFFMKSKPDTILTTANYFETGVDETSGIILRNPDGQMAVMALTMRASSLKEELLPARMDLLRFIIIQEEIKRRSLIQVMDIQKPSKQEKLHTHWIMK